MFIIYLLVYGVSYWPQTYYASQDDLVPLTPNPNPLSLSQCWVTGVHCHAWFRGWDSGIYAHKVNILPTGYTPGFRLIYL